MAVIAVREQVDLDHAVKVRDGCFQWIKQVFTRPPGDRLEREERDCQGVGLRTRMIASKRATTKANPIAKLIFPHAHKSAKSAREREWM